MSPRVGRTYLYGYLCASAFVYYTRTHYVYMCVRAYVYVRAQVKKKNKKIKNGLNVCWSFGGDRWKGRRCGGGRGWTTMTRPGIPRCAWLVSAVQGQKIPVERILMKAAEVRIVICKYACVDERLRNITSRYPRDDGFKTSKI